MEEQSAALRPSCVPPSPSIPLVAFAGNRGTTIIQGLPRDVVRQCMGQQTASALMSWTAELVSQSDRSSGTRSWLLRRRSWPGVGVGVVATAAEGAAVRPSRISRILLFSQNALHGVRTRALALRWPPS